MFGGGGGFGQSAFGQQPQQPSAFGQQPHQTAGFGQQPQQPTGFGTGFGAQQPQQSAFGGGAFGQQSTGFGASTGGFGSTASAFGAPPRPAFGASTGNSVFGAAGTQPASGFGGFGAATTPAFGSASTTGGLFGKPATSAFGSTQPTSAFGGSSAFGAPSSGFGAPSAGAFGGAGQAPGHTNAQENRGTGNPLFKPPEEKELLPGTTAAQASGVQYYQSIPSMEPYRNWSFEELRLQDYQMGKKNASHLPASTGFGGGFGSTSSAFGSNSFGATTTPASSMGGFGGGTSAFGGLQQTSGFGFGGQSSSATSGGLFGRPATTSTPGLFGGTSTPFGSATTTSAFGQSTGFGSSAFGSAQQRPAWGFGGATTASAGFGAPSTGGFGGFGARPATSTPAFGGFGNSFGSSFGTSAAPSTGPFGQTTSAPGTSGLFGSSTGLGTTQQRPGIGFGTTSTSGAPAFGQTTSTAAPGGLFSSAASTPGFGQHAPASTSILGSSSGGFGSGSFGSSLFGSSTAQRPTQGLFGGTTQPGSTPSSGLNFGQTSAPPSLFGASQTGGFGGLGGTSLFGSSTPGSSMGAVGTTGFGNTAGQPHPVLHAILDRNPYGSNPLFQPNVPVSSIGPTVLPAPQEKKKPAITPHFKTAPRSASKIKLRGFGASPLKKASSFESPTKLHILEGSSKDNITLGLDARFTPRKSAKRLNLDDTQYDSSPTASLDTTRSPAPPRKGVTFLEEAASRVSHRVSPAPEMDAAIDGASLDLSVLRTPTPSGRSVQEFVGPSTPTPIRSSSTESGDKFSKSLPFEDSLACTPSESPVPVPEYEMIPSFDDLMKMDDYQIANVENFTVRLKGVGQVKFLGEVNVLHASPTGTREGIKQIPGKIVILTPKSCTVYPSDTVKPPVGFGLNVPAEINLEGCWPIDKTTREPLKDGTDPRVDRHCKRLQNMSDTTFIGFNFKTGTWRFRVEHFTTYGLNDEDEDESPSQEEGSNTEVEFKSKFSKMRTLGSSRSRDFSISRGSSVTSNDTFRDAGLPKKMILDLEGASETAELEKNVEDVESEQESSSYDDMGQQEEQDSSESEETTDDEEPESEEGRQRDGEDARGWERHSEAADESSPELHQGKGYLKSCYNPATARVQQMKRSLFQKSNVSASVPSSVIRAPLQFNAADYRSGVVQQTTLAAPIATEGAISVALSVGPSNPITKRVRHADQERTALFSFAGLGPAARPRSSFDVVDEQTVPEVEGDSESELGPGEEDVFLGSPRKYTKVGDVDTVAPSAVNVASAVPLGSSLLFEKQNDAVDAGLAMGRSFRVGWGFGGKFIVAGR